MRAWMCYCLFLLASFCQCYGKNSGMQKSIYSRICNDIIYRNSSNFHRTSDRYRWHYYKHCRYFSRVSNCILVYRYFYKKNSEKFKKERLLHNMCICSTYYVLPSTIYFIFVMGNDSVTSNFTLRSIETVKFTIFYVAWVWLGIKSWDNQ